MELVVYLTYKLREYQGFLLESSILLEELSYHTGIIDYYLGY